MKKLTRRKNPKPSAAKPEHAAAGAVAAWMNRPLERRPSRPADAVEREALAIDELFSCADAMQRAFLSGNDEFMAFLIYEVAQFASEFLSARAAQGRIESAANLINLRAAVDAAIGRIPARTPSGKIALAVSEEIKARRKPVGSPRGGPKLDWSTPDNRTVLELYGRIEAYRHRWSNMKSADAQTLLDEIPAACVALDDFGPGTWAEWHEAGKIILRADGQSASSHLRAAWERVSKMHFSVPATARDWY